MALRRTVPVVVATASGLALLVSFHTTPAPSSLAATASGGSSTTSSPTTAQRFATTTTTAPVRQVTGPVVQTKFGPVEVRLTVQAGRILDVQALQLPDAHPRSVRISNEAAPQLRVDVLQAQSARIHVISGASYTSVGYANSVQGALDLLASG